MQLKSGEKVIDRPKSHIDLKLLDLINKAISNINSNNRIYIEETYDFGKNIGYCNIIETNKDDIIYFAKRYNRNGLSRFVKGKSPKSCSKLTVVLKKASDGEYILITAFIGEITPPEPFDKNANELSIGFWSNHAFIEDLVAQSK